MIRWQLLVLTLALGACQAQGDTFDKPEPKIPTEPIDPGTDPTVRPDGYDELLLKLAESKDWTPEDFLGAYTPQFAADLSYDPTQAQYLDLVAGSSLALDSDETARLSTDGFVITDDQFPSFVYGYHTIYMEDLPVYVSADAILYAVHRSYDAILVDIEQQALIGSLRTVLEQARIALNQGEAAGFSADVETDLDLHLAVALSLLDGSVAPPIAGADAVDIQSFIDRAIAAKGSERVMLYGSERLLDFSQFEPRGHYTLNEELERYFRAVMWLGRIDFRFLEPNDENKLVFSRRQFYLTVALNQLVTGEARDNYDLIDRTIGAFVGEPDGLHLGEVDALLTALGLADARDAADLSDEDIAATIQKYQFGAQRISSHFMINGIAGTTKPLSHSFAALPQRYVLDSHVFSNVVYDRVQSGNVYRMMPDPLDVAFAALGNDQAGVLLADQLSEYDYQHDLNAMRILADSHDEAFWGANLYNLWLSAIRGMSPNDDLADLAASGLPAVAATEPWGRRVINAQLASWAELRHDTILYTKQSYTGGAACEYPDAYVEPYPAVFDALAAFAQKGITIANDLDHENAAAYFERLEAAVSRLGDMAAKQRSGEPHDADDVAWINQAVMIEPNCDGTLLGAQGWYADLYYSGQEMDFDPTIADVHTQPTDESGNVVGKVLHVGTGMPNAMVVTVETCEGPRAYVGLVSSYHEEVTQNFERMTDEQWAPEVMSGAVTRPAWVSPLGL